MNKKQQKTFIRWVYMVIGVISMLFAGILYAWSILKAPLSTEFGWEPSQLAFNFTIAMTFFCIGGLVGANIFRRMGHRIALITAGVFSALGFGLTSLLSGNSVVLLYITYGVLAGLGIGIAYNVLIATVSAWFPDKKGLCSGCMMMGFGASALILGNLADAMFKSALGWRTTYVILGVVIFVILVLAAFLLKLPSADVLFEKKAAKKENNTEQRDFTTKEMLCRPSFWMGFLCISFLAALGSSVISFAKDIALSVNAPEALAVSLVGVLSISNGIGRILTGVAFDIAGRRKTMLSANALAICAAGVILIAVSFTSLPLCVVGLCLAGMSYGSCATMSATFTSSFFGMKYFSNNMAIMTCNAMVASFVATISAKVFEATGGYTVTFIMLLALACVAFVLNIFVRRP